MGKTGYDDGEDVALLQRWIAGDRVAGDRLVRRHFQDVRHYFQYRVTKAEDREDLISKTMLALVESGGNFRGASTFRAFLFGIARNKLREYLRKMYKNKEDYDMSADARAATRDHSLSSDARFRENVSKMVAVLGQLSTDDFLLVSMSYWQRKKGPELEHVLGVNRDAIRSRLWRLRKAMGKRMEARGPVSDDDFAEVANTLQTLWDMMMDQADPLGSV